MEKQHKATQVSLQAALLISALGTTCCCLILYTSMLHRKTLFLRKQLEDSKYSKDRCQSEKEEGGGGGAKSKTRVQHEDEESIHIIDNTGTSTVTVTQQNDINKTLCSSNNKNFTLTEIGIITSPFPLRAGTPRQGLLAPHSRSILTLHSFIPKEAFDDLEQYSHVSFYKKKKKKKAFSILKFLARLLCIFKFV